MDALHCMISGMRFAPFRFCHCPRADIISLNATARLVFWLRHPLVFAGSVADGGEDAFDRVCCSDVLPVLGWEIVDGQKYVAIFGQCRSGFINDKRISL